MLALDHLLEQLAVGVLGDPHVELQVLAVHGKAEAVVFAAARQPLEERVDVAGQAQQLAAVHGRGALGEEPRRLGFERLAQLVQLAHVGPASGP